VAGADPAEHSGTPFPVGGRHSNLAMRVASSLVLAPLAVATAYAGGYVFLAFWTFAALGVFWEWTTLVCTHDRKSMLIIGSAALVGACGFQALGYPTLALLFLALGALAAAALASRIHRGWCAAGVAYAGAMLMAPVLLRDDAVWGFPTLLYLFAVVWSTDIAAYFGGRTIGGPKLMPRISPNKTWSGAVSGALAAVIFGCAVAAFAGIPNVTAIGIVALVLSVGSQAGDLFESSLKRRFGAKDASNLLPGHGGLMDRLDGFVAAAVAAVLIGIVHGGVAAPARGVMVW
jgi:phosphatidate cytidylyltransferase